jgi:hypothetical protein
MNGLALASRVQQSHCLVGTAPFIKDALARQPPKLYQQAMPSTGTPPHPMNGSTNGDAEDERVREVLSSLPPAAKPPGDDGVDREAAEGDCGGGLTVWLVRHGERADEARSEEAIRAAKSRPWCVNKHPYHPSNTISQSSQPEHSTDALGSIRPCAASAFMNPPSPFPACERHLPSPQDALLCVFAS